MGRFTRQFHAGGRDRGEHGRRALEAIDLAVRHAGVVGDAHKSWVIDQMVRVLAGGDYDRIIREVRQGERGPMTHDWETGEEP